MKNDLEKLFDNDLTPPTPKEEIIIDGVDVRGCEYYKGKCMEYTHYCQIGCKECTDIGTKLCHYKQTEKFKAKIARLEQENKELKEWKDKVVKLFESACRCKYLNEETDICSYTNEKCININKCAYKYQELSDNYRSALEEINRVVKLAHKVEDYLLGQDYTDLVDRIEKEINEVLQEGKINE